MAAHSLGSYGPAGDGSSWHLGGVNTCLWDLVLRQEGVKENLGKVTSSGAKSNYTGPSKVRPQEQAAVKKCSEATHPTRSEAELDQEPSKPTGGLARGLRCPRVVRPGNSQTRNSVTCHEIR